MKTMYAVAERTKGLAYGVKKKLLLETLRLLLGRKKGRGFLLRKAERDIENILAEHECSGIPYFWKVKSKFIIALIKQSLHNIDRGFISSHYTGRIIDVMGEKVMLKDRWGVVSREFEEKYGQSPPGFFTISPTQKCNLKCIGCYASSSAKTAASLPYPVVKRTIQEMHDIAGSRFVVISGGEPFLWKDEGKGILDLAEEFSDVFFLVYTNSLAIGREEAERMEKAGNITPAISVEGYEAETDQRRGQGVFKRIREKMELLKDVGVPFGLSVTATKQNMSLLRKEEFYDHWFKEVGATYMWMFHLMPIGRARENIPLMISAEERKELFILWEKMLFEKQYFVGDFWNSGAASTGCIAYGRGGGYFYIDWNGNIMPCVFVPYYKDNILEVYKAGKTVFDALMSDFFKNGRQWQKKYGYLDEHPKNVLAPCSIRDHYRYFREKILPADARPEDENARISLEDPEYFEALDEFDHQLWKLTDPLWEERLNLEPAADLEIVTCKPPPK